MITTWNPKRYSRYGLIVIIITLLVFQIPNFDLPQNNNVDPPRDSSIVDNNKILDNPNQVVEQSEDVTDGGENRQPTNPERNIIEGSYQSVPPTQEWYDGETVRVDFPARNTTVKSLDSSKYYGHYFDFEFGSTSEPWGMTSDENGYIYVSDSVDDVIYIYASNGTLVDQFGSTGSGNGQFNTPRDIAIDADGNIYIADKFNYRIQKFDSSYTYVTQWGSFGTGNGQFNAPGALAMGPDGNLYVLDEFVNDRVQVFDTSGTWLDTWGTTGSSDGQLDNPEGIAVDRYGYVYVSGPNNDWVQKFESDGTFILNWDVTDAWRVAVHKDRVYTTTFTSEDLVYVHDTNGNYLYEFSVANPEAITFDSENNLYVSKDNGAIRKYSYGNMLPVVEGSLPYNQDQSFQEFTTISSNYIEQTLEIEYTLYDTNQPDILNILFDVDLKESNIYNNTVQAEVVSLDLSDLAVYGPSELRIRITLHFDVTNGYNVTLGAFDTGTLQYVESTEKVSNAFLSDNIYFKMDMVWAEVETKTHLETTRLRYVSSDITLREIDIEIFEFGISLRVYSPLSWSLTYVNPVVSFSWDSTNNWWSIPNTFPSIMTMRFFSGVGYGAEYSRQPQYAALEETTDTFIDCSSFECGSNKYWIQKENNEFEGLSLNNSIVESGSFSLRVESESAASEHDLYFGDLSDGDYYLLFNYYFEGGVTGDWRLYWYDGIFGTNYVSLDDSNTDRWQYEFIFIHIDGDSTGRQINLYSSAASVGVLFIDNVRLFKASGKVETIDYSEYELSAQVLSVPSFIPIINQEIQFELRDRTDDTSIMKKTVFTDEYGIGRSMYKGILEIKEYEFRVWSFESTLGTPSEIYENNDPTEATTGWSSGGTQQSLRTNIDAQNGLSIENYVSGTATQAFLNPIYDYSGASTFDISNVDYMMFDRKDSHSLTADCSNTDVYFYTTVTYGDYRRYSQTYDETYICNMDFSDWTNVILDLELYNLQSGTWTETIDSFYFRFKFTTNAQVADYILLDNLHFIQTQKSYFTPLPSSNKAVPYDHDGIKEDIENFNDFSEGICENENSGVYYTTSTCFDGKFHVEDLRSTVGAYIYMRFGIGYNYPIDASVYDHLVMRFRFNHSLDNSLGGEITVYDGSWTNVVGTYEGGVLEADTWHLVVIDLREYGSDWTGTETGGFQFNFNDDGGGTYSYFANSTYTEFDLDYFYVTNGWDQGFALEFEESFSSDSQAELMYSIEKYDLDTTGDLEQKDDYLRVIETDGHTWSGINFLVEQSPKYTGTAQIKVRSISGVDIRFITYDYSGTSVESTATFTLDENWQIIQLEVTDIAFDHFRLQEWNQPGDQNWDIAWMRYVSDDIQPELQIDDTTGLAWFDTDNNHTEIFQVWINGSSYGQYIEYELFYLPLELDIYYEMTYTMFYDFDDPNEPQLINTIYEYTYSYTNQFLVIAQSHDINDFTIASFFTSTYNYAYIVYQNNTNIGTGNGITTGTTIISDRASVGGYYEYSIEFTSVVDGAIRWFNTTYSVARVPPSNQPPVFIGMWFEGETITIDIDGVKTYVSSYYQYVTEFKIKHVVWLEFEGDIDLLTVYFPMHWNETSLNLDGISPISTTNNNWVYSEPYLGVDYIWTSFSGANYGFEYKRGQQILALEDVTGEYLHDGNFEEGWAEDWINHDTSPYNTVTLDSDIVYSGGYSLKLEALSGVNYFTIPDESLPDGEYYISFSYYYVDIGTTNKIYWSSSTSGFDNLDLQTSDLNKWIHHFQYIGLVGGAVAGGDVIDINIRHDSSALLYIDDFRLWKASGTIKTVDYSETELSATFISWDGYQNPVLANQKVEFDLRDRPDDQSLISKSVWTDSNGLAVYPFKGTLDVQEHELRWWSWQNRFSSVSQSENLLDPTKWSLADTIELQDNGELLLESVSGADDPRFTPADMDLTEVDYIYFDIYGSVSTYSNAFRLYPSGGARDILYYGTISDHTFATTPADVWVVPDTTGGYTTGNQDLDDIAYFTIFITTGTYELYIKSAGFIKAQSTYFTPIPSGTQTYSYENNGLQNNLDNYFDFSEGSRADGIFEGNINTPLEVSVQDGYLHLEADGASEGATSHTTQEHILDFEYYNTAVIRYRSNQTTNLYFAYEFITYENLQVLQDSNDEWIQLVFDISGYSSDSDGTNIWFLMTGFPSYIDIDHLFLVHSWNESYFSEFEENGYTDGWSGVSGATVEQENGHLLVEQPAPTDVFFGITNDIEYIDTGKMEKLTIRYKSTGTVDGVNIAYYDLSTNYISLTGGQFILTASTEFIDYTIDLSSNSGWDGDIYYTGLAFVFYEATGNDEIDLEIEWIRFSDTDLPNDFQIDDSTGLAWFDNQDNTTDFYQIWINGSDYGIIEEYFKFYLPIQDYTTYLITFSLFYSDTGLLPNTIYEYEYYVSVDQWAFISIVDQRGENIPFEQYRIEINGERLPERYFYWTNTATDRNITISDFWDNIIWQDTSYSYETFIDIVVTLYSVKIWNNQDVAVFVEITSGPTFSEWIFPQEIIEYRLPSASYNFTIEYTTDTTGFTGVTLNGTSAQYIFTPTGDTGLVITGISVSDVYQNTLQLEEDLGSTNSTIHTQLALDLSNVTLQFNAIDSNITLLADNITLLDSNLSGNFTFIANLIEFLDSNLQGNFTVITDFLTVMNSTITGNVTFIATLIDILDSNIAANFSIELALIDATNATQVTLLVDNYNAILDAIIAAEDYMSIYRAETRDIHFNTLSDLITWTFTSNWGNGTSYVYINGTFVTSGAEGTLVGSYDFDIGFYNASIDVVFIGHGNLSYVYGLTVTELALVDFVLYPVDLEGNLIADFPLLPYYNGTALARDVIRAEPLSFDASLITFENFYGHGVSVINYTIEATLTYNYRVLVMVDLMKLTFINSGQTLKLLNVEHNETSSIDSNVTVEPFSEKEYYVRTGNNSITSDIVNADGTTTRTFTISALSTKINMPSFTRRITVGTDGNDGDVTNNSSGDSNTILARTSGASAGTILFSMLIAAAGIFAREIWMVVKSKVFKRRADESILDADYTRGGRNKVTSILGPKR